MRILAGIFGLVFAVQMLSAQAPARKPSDFPPPHSPFVKPVPEKASWTIVPQETSSEPKKGEVVRAQPRIVSIESLRNGDLKRDLIVYSSGQREEIWYFQGQALLSTDGGKVVVRSQAILDDGGHSEGVFRLLGNDFKAAGFPGLKWVDQKYYTGVVMFNDIVPCYHYVLRGKDPNSEADIDAGEAWISAENGLPVAYISENALYVYRFGEPPVGTLALPPIFEAAFLKVKQAQDRQRRLEADAALQ